MRFTVDSNVLVYAYDEAAGVRHAVALALLERAFQADLVITIQSLGELFHVLTRKGKLPAERAKQVVARLSPTAEVIAADEDCLTEAMDMVARHQWSFWDVMMFATARQAGCALLVSEDGQDRRHLDALTIVTPFTDTPSPLLEKALAPP
ncbi:PIN domain-containing protein [Caenispirillum salinarum]|uniref:PIN domain-containing protein n=1 Tax=Caenispirillum salinarum TaxID=859058 RepID=UPI00384F6B4F